MRRRLWHEICILDLNTALDRGSNTIILENSSATPWPAIINDADISPNSRSECCERNEFTDMSFVVLCLYGNFYLRKLTYVPRGETTRQPHELEGNWEKRQEMANEFKQTIEEKCLRYCDENIPFQWFAKSVGKVVGLGMTMAVVRPLQRHPKTVPPQVESSKILSLAVDILALNWQINADPRTEPWRWFIWVQWHALAVATAELCNQTKGPLVDKAWEIVNAVYETQANEVADSARGMLWQPISKLMRRAQRNRAGAQAVRFRQSSAIEWNNSIQTFLPPSQNAPMQLSPSSMTDTCTSNLLPSTEFLGFGQVPMPDINNNNGLAQTSEWNNRGFPSLDNDPFGMAWVNWENFVEDIKVNDFDMTEPWRALQP